jgi:hypothetical protein
VEIQRKDAGAGAKRARHFKQDEEVAKKEETKEITTTQKSTVRRTIRFKK